MSYLADTSAVWRLLRRQVDERWVRNGDHGLVAICPPVESELMTGLRGELDYTPFTMELRNFFTWIPALDDPWPQVLSVQRDLVKIGHHRGPSTMDILIALTARRHGLTLVHVDGDFASIAKVRPDIPMIRLDEQAE